MAQCPNKIDKVVASQLMEMAIRISAWGHKDPSLLEIDHSQEITNQDFLVLEFLVIK